jgi:hypothetical protein
VVELPGDTGIQHVTGDAQEMGCINLTSVVEVFKTYKMLSSYEETQIYSWVLHIA